MKTIKWVIWAGIIGGLVLFVLQYSVISNQLKELRMKNEKLIGINKLHMADLMLIINSNTCPIDIEGEFNSTVESLNICIDYPVCHSCFTGVSHFLFEYSKKNKMNLTIFCSSKYIKQIKKILLFEELGEINVKPLIGVDKLPSKVTVIYSSIEGNQFYLPLPERQEVNFLETFLTSSLLAPIMER